MKALIFSLLLAITSIAVAVDNTVVVIETNKGNIKVELLPEKTPITVQNFLHYVDSGYYNGLIFHRVIDDFMIQGGGFTPGMQQKQTELPIKNEADKSINNKRGTIAMARTNEVNSATSQFFINVVDNNSLNFRDMTPSGYGYTVFGRVIEGMNVVDKIAEAPTGSRQGYNNVPLSDIVITSIHRERG